MGKVPVTIRKMHRSDTHKGFLETLKNLSSLDGLMPFEALEIFKKRIERYPDMYRIFVAELDGEIIGTITLLVEQKIIHGGGKVGHIEDVATRKGFERQGIGRALVKRALTEAVKTRCYKVILDCSEGNAPFYEKLGFQRHEIAMRRDISLPPKKQ